ncbi:methionine ABC transporter permease [Nonomuraea sp. bgisy101]|uniref:methionine ABC transporter permease n=1 Tax=Nonomuraea sp. bgisy101 TaxID=3413784 RepID=UPI003D740980
MTWEEMVPLLGQATWETVQMVFWSTLFTVVFGLPLGVALVGTSREGLFPSRIANQLLSLVVNIGRSLPFIILMIAVIPFTRLLVGTTIGLYAAVVPLTIGAVPFFARLVEIALRGVSADVVQAAHAMGVSRTSIVAKVLLPEAKSALVAGITVTVITLVSYSAMAGVIGAGGLGDLAIRYGYQRFETPLMIATCVVIIILVQLAQTVGDALANRLAARR